MGRLTLLKKKLSGATSDKIYKIDIEVYKPINVEVSSNKKF